MNEFFQMRGELSNIKTKIQEFQDEQQKQKIINENLLN